MVQETEPSAILSHVQAVLILRRRERYDTVESSGGAKIGVSSKLNQHVLVEDTNKNEITTFAI